MKKFVVGSLLVLSSLHAWADMYKDMPDSWLYYREPKKEEKPVKNPDAPKPPQATMSVLTAKETLRKMGEAWEEMYSQAVLNPTTENIVAEMAAKQRFMAMSEQFANRYQQVLWQTPEFDYTLEHPMRTDGLWAAGTAGYEKLEQDFKGAAGKFGLLYVFRSDCPYCKKFSPILKKFVEQYGFSLITVTLDGQGTDMFPNPSRDLAALRRRGALPQVVPAVYLVDPAQPNAQPLGFGMMNEADLQARVASAAGINMNYGAVSKAGEQP